MPSLIYNLEEYEQSISRPIVVDAITQIVKELAISPDYQLIYRGELGAVIQPQSVTGGEVTATLANQNCIEIDVQEEYAKDVAASGVVHGEDVPAFFRDSAIGLNVKTVYATSKLTITFKYSSNSKNAVRKWQAYMRLRASTCRYGFKHNVTYHIPLPETLLQLIKDIHTAREACEGYGDTFTQYFMSHASPDITALKNQNGQTGVIVIAQTQADLVGYFDIPVVPDREEDDTDKSVWTSTINYTLSYERPLAISAKFPIMVHQSMLPSKYIVKINDWVEPNKPPQIKTRNRRLFDAFSAYSRPDITSKLRRTVNIPAIDQVVIKDPLRGHFPVMTILSVINPSDLKEFVSLNDLGDYVIDSLLLDFIGTSEYQFIGKTNQSVFQITRVEDIAIYYNGTTCDANLNIRSVNDLNKRAINRLIFSLVVDLRLLSKDAIARLKANPPVLRRVIAYINEVIKYDKTLHTNKVTYELLLALGLTSTYIQKNLQDILINDPAYRKRWAPITVQVSNMTVDPIVTKVTNANR